MFTFRDPSEPMHSHRLLYLHATARDHQIVDPSKRFKTEPDDSRMQRCPSAPRRNPDSQSTLTKTYSQKKIKYFDLDLRALMETAGFESAAPIKNERIASEAMSRWTSAQTKNSRVVLSAAQTNNLAHPKKQSASEKWAPSTKNTPSSRIKANEITEKITLSGLLDKENLQDLWQPISLKDKKRAKLLQKDMKEVNMKYHKLKQKSTKPLQSLTKSLQAGMRTCQGAPGAWGRERRQEAVSGRQQGADLHVRRIEKVLADSAGNEYRVTIERV